MKPFRYDTKAWKPGVVRYEISQLAAWCGWYPQDKKRYGDWVQYAEALQVTPQLCDGFVAARLAENECKVLRARTRQVKVFLRTPEAQKLDSGIAEAYEVIRFNLRLAEWAREFLMGRISREALQQRFDARAIRNGYPGVTAAYARRLLFLKVVQFAF